MALRLRRRAVELADGGSGTARAAAQWGVVGRRLLKVERIARALVAAQDWEEELSSASWRGAPVVVEHRSLRREHVKTLGKREKAGFRTCSWREMCRGENTGAGSGHPSGRSQEWTGHSHVTVTARWTLQRIRRSFGPIDASWAGITSAIGPPTNQEEACDD